jgi:hypothetical protein
MRVMRLVHRQAVSEQAVCAGRGHAMATCLLLWVVSTVLLLCGTDGGAGRMLCHRYHAGAAGGHWCGHVVGGG